MEYKIIVLSLILVMSLSLVYAFESSEYNIGMNIPPGEEGSIEVIIEPGIEFNITNETNNPSNAGTFGGSPSGGGGNPKGSNIIPTEGNNFNSDNDFEGDNEIETISANESPNIFSRITGRVIETLGTTGTVIIGMFILGTIGVFIFIKIKKRKRN